MRTSDRSNITNPFSLIPLKKFGILTGVMATFAAFGGACSDAQPVTTTGAGGSVMSSSSSGKGGAGGESSSSSSSTSSSSSSSSGGGGGSGGSGGDGGASSSSSSGSSSSSSSSSSSASSSSSSSSSGSVCPMVTNGGATKLAAAFGDASAQSGASVVYDKSGNLLVTGSFAGSINFGATTLTSAGGDDVFVAKFNPGGQLLWAKKFGDGNVQTASSIGVDANGNLYVTGNFKGAINFGGGNLNATGTLFVDVFLAKLTSDGNHVWSKSFGDMNVQNVRAMAVDTGGNIVITGFFQNDINFGGATLTSAGLYDVFLAKFTTDGMHQWSRRFGDATADQNGRALALDSMGNIYLAGDLGGSIDFGGGPKMATATKVAFATKFDSLGNATWVKLSTGTGTDRASANAIAVGPMGEVLVGGNFRGAFDLGGGTIMNPDVDDAFITLFDATGAHTLTKSFGDVDSQTTTGVAVAANGDMIATGNFSGSIDVGTGMPITSAGAFDGFLARWDAKGCPVWVRSYPGAMVQLTQSLALDPTTGGVALTGLFNGSVNFGTGTLTAAGDDAFLLSAGP